MEHDQTKLVRISEVSREFGLSQTRIRQLTDSGVLPSSRTAGGHRLFDLAAVRAALARRSLSTQESLPGPPDPTWRRRLTLLGLAEHEVWRRVVEDLGLDIDNSAGRILGYAFQEMLNNAIDHSRSEAVTITWWIDPDQWAFEITDDGIGVYANLLAGLRLGSEFEAVQELSKGKRTTDPSRHTGKGIFFSSKAVDAFRLTSSGVRWTVDNLCQDTALGSVPPGPGTTVFCRLDPHTDRVLADVFRRFTEDHAFVRIRPVVKLFEIGTEFVSRSEARRLLAGLDHDFEVVEVDFTGVIDVGQGFVDELLRVWPRAHPGKRVLTVNMNQAVEFMVTRGLRRAAESS